MREGGINGGRGIGSGREGGKEGGREGGEGGREGGREGGGRVIIDSAAYYCPYRTSHHTCDALTYLHTVRLAAVEVTELAALLTTHRYSPSSLSATISMV